MKHSIKFGLMGGMILFCLSMSLTSCEDILGHWEKPTPATAGGGSTATVASLTITDELLRLEKATPQAIAFTVDPVDATITWTSDNEAVATVDANGQITPIKRGTVTIKATAGDKTATSTVIVYDKIFDISTGDADVTANEEWLINGDGTAVAKANGITIGDGATVTLNGINISKQIKCSNTGNSTIILADGSENKVTVSTDEKAGIQIGGTFTTLTINAETAGTGTLTVQGGNGSAGIGTKTAATSGGITGGDITINGGIITATGGDRAAGIGTGYAFLFHTTCGAITINGGKVNATGGQYAAGIGTGYANTASMTNKCGDITIDTGVISVTAKKSSINPGPNSIGKGKAEYDGTQACGTVTIGGVVGEITTSPYTYTPAP